MSFLLSSRIRRWVILAIAVPLGSWLLAKVADRVRERRGGDSKIAKALSAPQHWRQRRSAKAAAKAA
jgi:hypothetical protein